MRKPALITILLLAIVAVIYVMSAKRAAEEEAELWSEALDPVF
ncbi:MAG: DLW-39 family protein [Propionibacteriaceae bacterium]|jgi:cbb3-type cytochrome oxidase subunit 3|nr:DLW-39 family protein [Propionibacteriaceae bacterium]